MSIHCRPSVNQMILCAHELVLTFRLIHSRILAANRDEFLSRPTTEAAWHSEFNTHQSNNGSNVLSGLDLTAGGTWLGLAKSASTNSSASSLSAKNDITQPRLLLAALTNFTETITNERRPSRGRLVKDFLAGSHKGLNSYLEKLEREKFDYAGYNCLLGEMTNQGWRLAYSCNREAEEKKSRLLELPVKGKVRGVSNSTLEIEPEQEEWPKMISGCKEMERILQITIQDGDNAQENLIRGLWDVLR